jgi:aromatic-L-amino-acid decarboxylase
MAIAAELERSIRDDPSFELLAPRNFSVVVLRFRPPDRTEAELDALNARILDAVNASGEIFLSHTRVRGRFAIRVAIGNLRTQQQHVARAWQLIRASAAKLVEA